MGRRTLVDARPDLAAEWHPTKNGALRPEDVTVSSKQKVWWRLSYDVPMDYEIECVRGKHFDFEWQAIVRNRVNCNSGCPFLSGKAVWKGFNDLMTTNPELATQWHPIKNGELTPYDVRKYSGKKVWWYLPYDVPMDYPVECLRGKHFDFEWQAVVAWRSAGNGCPFLSSHAAWKGFNDLGTLRPDLAKEWHPTKNGALRPEDVTVSSNKNVWWYLPYDVPEDYPVEHLRGKHFDFEWKATVNRRDFQNQGCPFLSGRSVWKGFNDLTTANPELAKEWHPTKNGDLTPEDVTVGSYKKVWWYLPYDVPEDYPVKHLRGKHFDFEWQAVVKNRYNGYGCPYLTNNIVWKGFNDLETVNPEIAKEWHPTKNNGVTAADVTSGSDKVAWWLLIGTDEKTGEEYCFEWKAVIKSRTVLGAGCPYVYTYKGEEHVKTYLKNHNINFEQQKKFQDLRGTGNGQLSYDFAIRDDRYGLVLIEYNGMQHYKAVNHFGGEDKLKIQKQHDKLKRDYAKKHGYKLITIKYTYDTYESVTEYLDKMLAA